jgi:predicted metal-dependent phosphoesterase TrpH
VSIREAEAAGLDAVEVANSAQWPYWYIRGKNQKLSERLRLPQTGGSDSHIPDTFGRAYTEVEAEEATAEAVLKAIRDGYTSPVDGATTWRERARKWIR